MSPRPSQFLGIDAPYTDPETAAFLLLPFPCEGGVSGRPGTAAGPDAMLAASREIELYDEELRAEPYRCGIATLAPPPIPSQPGQVPDALYAAASPWLARGRFMAVIGGDHSISTGYARALKERFGSLSVVQLDAHADLRESYEGSPHSHACVMSRLRELTPHTLQLGVRSLSRQEAERIEQENIQVVSMQAFREGRAELDKRLRQLPDPVFVTLDVDVLDWSVVRATGTPEPGGFSWHEAVAVLRAIFRARRVVGFDVVELCADPGDHTSAVAVARLVYRMLGLKLAAFLRAGGMPWPDRPRALAVA